MAPPSGDRLESPRALAAGAVTGPAISSQRMERASWRGLPTPLRPVAVRREGVIQHRHQGVETLLKPQDARHRRTAQPAELVAQRWENLLDGRTRERVSDATAPRRFVRSLQHCYDRVHVGIHVFRADPALTRLHLKPSRGPSA